MFKKVVLVGRRQVELPKGPGYDKMVRAFRMLGVCMRERGALLCGPLGSDSLCGRPTCNQPNNLTKQQEQRVLDFDKLLEAEGKAALRGCDVGFCALGTTRGKSGVVGLCVWCWDTSCVSA